MSPRSLAPLLALLALAAGCVGAPEDVDAADAGTLTGATLGLPVTEVIEGSIDVSIATPVRTLNNGGAFLTLLTVGENATGYVLEVEWAAATPASESLSLWVRASGQGTLPPSDPMDLVTLSEPLAKVSGPSPLRVALPIDAFPEPGDYDILVRAADEPVGAAANQPYTLHLTRFEGVAFDEAFSALGAA